MVSTDNIQPIRLGRVVCREYLANSSDVGVNAALLKLSTLLATYGPPNRPKGSKYLSVRAGRYCAEHAQALLTNVGRKTADEHVAPQSLGRFG